MKTQTFADEVQMTKVLKKYEGPLMRYALRFTRDLESARDIVQDTFLKLCDADLLEVKNYLKPWLFRVCRNRAIDCFRRDRHLKLIANDEKRDCPDERPSAQDTLEQSETEDRVLALVAELPEKEQEVIRLKFQESMSYQEISDITRLSVSHVGVLIHQGMTTLREKMGAPLKKVREQQS